MIASKLWMTRDSRRLGRKRSSCCGRCLRSTVRKRVALLIDPVQAVKPTFEI